MRLGRSVLAPVDGFQGQAEQRRAPGEKFRVAGEHELTRPVGERRGQREVGADAGGFAGRDDQAPGAQGFLIST